MHVEDGGNFDAAEALIFPGLRALPPVAVAFVVRIGLAITRQGRVRILLMQAQGVFEQGGLGSERSRLGRHVHRRTDDSILSIMAGMMPVRTDQGKARYAESLDGLVGLLRR
ncbi:hypothetical protein ACH4T9_19075 [Micromonospora sp. NPDC020750]|uniref:hypothetical protein n=1 Tax=Micromonospora sp. NPDC020750 TaxID=3364239 RepID=UPI00378FCCB9